MPTGLLQVTVTTQESLPLENVKITITDGQTLKVLEDKALITDQNGQSRTIELETVSAQYSFDKDNLTVMPYKNYNLTLEKEGFIRGEIIGVQIFEGQLSLQRADLLPRPTDFGNGFEQRYSQSAVQKLFNSEPNLQQGISEYVLQTVVIPEYVTVHLGRPDRAAENVRVPFRTYLKSVAASEIYPTWPYESLKANIWCQITFILNRIYTEWYRSRGYNFDITNSTSYDQKYIHNRSTFQSTDRVVEEVFNNYVTRTFSREPYFTEYCDGRQVTCPGLKQWGTYELANQGLDALQILKYYYGDDIQVNQTDNIAALPASYPGTPLRIGSQGQAVQIIQAQLNRISDNYPALPKQPVDGIYGQNTRDIVRRFQRIFNLTADGVVGKTTWYKISYIYVSVKKLAQLTSEGESIEDGGYPGYVVKRGDRGLNVVIVQFYINQTAVYVSSISPVELDGVFGPALEEQVKNFQRYFNLSPDGKVGALTWDKMLRIFKSIQSGVDYPRQTPPAADAYPGYLIRVGAAGENVRKIQQWLAGVAQENSRVTAPAVDGIFGSGTQRAVISFQRRYSLTPDGIVGPATWNSLYNTWQNLVADNLI